MATKRNNKLFLLSVDLHKAYDSIPRTALRCALQKYGMPNVIIELIGSLYGYSDSLRWEIKTISVQNGLNQLCIITPTLILYYELVLLDGLVGVKQFCGVEVWFKLGGKLLERELGDKALLYYQSACPQMMLLWCLSVGRIC